ncbi:MAG: hypothetical protein FJ315_03675 [SAR202 cluster bacterium]|nr:hypothetical protein [SAR202 cluster bacterium]
MAPRFLTEAQLSEQQFDPTVDYPWTQTDWSVGMGGVEDRDHPRKLGSGYRIDTSDPGKIKPSRRAVTTTLNATATSHRVTGFAIVGTEVWAFVGREVYSRNSGNSNWTQATTPEAATKIYRNGVSFRGNVFTPGWVQATNVADTYIYKSDADANWTLSTLSNSDVKYMAVAGNLMYGGNWSDGVNLVRTSVDPTNSGAWSGPYEVGGSDADITALVSHGDTMLICKADGIYTIQADGSVKNLTPAMEDAEQHPDNFKGAINWNEHILLPIGLGGLKEMVGEELVDISLSRYMPRDTQLHGRVVAISGNSQELYLMVHESDQERYHLVKGIWAQQLDGHYDWTWHHIARQSYTTATDDDQNALLAEGIPNGTAQHRRLLVGFSSTGSNLGPTYLPSDRDAEDAYNDNDDSQAVTTGFDAGLPRVPKHFSSVYFETDNLGSGVNDHSINVYYRLDAIGGARATNSVTGWTSLGSLTQDQQTLTFGAEVTGRRLELAFVFIQGTTLTTAPELHKFTLRCQVRPTSLKVLPLSLDFLDGQAQYNGIPDYRTQESLTQLRAWAESTAEVTVRVKDSTNVRGMRSFHVVFLPGSFKEEVMWHEWGRPAELRVSALVAEV